MRRTAKPLSSHYELVELSAEALRPRIAEALSLYTAAMRYPRETADQQAPMWLAHMLRDSWRCVAALDEHNQLLGISYGYRGMPGQWWYAQVRRGLTELAGASVAQTWLQNYFELTELHVRPDWQGRGIGERLLHQLVNGVPMPCVLLSTPEGTSRAWRLYRRVGFIDLLRNYRFGRDPRPVAVLGRTLPLER